MAWDVPLGWNLGLPVMENLMLCAEPLINCVGGSCGVERSPRVEPRAPGLGTIADYTMRYYNLRGQTRFGSGLSEGAVA